MFCIEELKTINHRLCILQVSVLLLSSLACSACEMSPSSWITEYLTVYLHSSK